MTQQASKTLIGGFVVGALALAVAGIMIFGSGKFFKKTTEYSMYFHESVKGLNQGAPVVFQGVKIGSVVNIQIIADADALTLEIPVIVEVEHDKIQVSKGKRSKDRGVDIARLIDRGLRAQLQSQSMVTGQLMIAMDFYPDKPANLIGEDPTALEIPTIPSALESITQTIKELNLTTLAANLTGAVHGLERILNSPEITKTLHVLHQTITDTQKLIVTTTSRIDPLADTLEKTMQDTDKLIRHADRQIGLVGTSMDTTMKDARKLIRDVDVQVGPLAQSLRATADDAGQTFHQAEKTLQSLREVLGKDSPMLYQANRTLNQLSEAARSIRVWAEYLERHPEALIRGKK